MKLELIKRNLNNRGQPETLYKTDLPVSEDINIIELREAFRRLFKATILHRNIYKDENGEVTNTTYPNEVDYRIEILVDANDSVYVVGLIENIKNNNCYAIDYIYPSLEST